MKEKTLLIVFLVHCFNSLVMLSVATHTHTHNTHTHTMYTCTHTYSPPLLTFHLFFTFAYTPSRPFSYPSSSPLISPSYLLWLLPLSYPPYLLWSLPLSYPPTFYGLFPPPYLLWSLRLPLTFMVSSPLTFYGLFPPYLLWFLPPLTFSTTFYIIRKWILFVKSSSSWSHYPPGRTSYRYAS